MGCCGSKSWSNDDEEDFVARPLVQQRKNKKSLDDILRDEGNDQTDTSKNSKGPEPKILTAEQRARNCITGKEEETEESEKMTKLFDKAF